MLIKMPTTPIMLLLMRIAANKSHLYDLPKMYSSVYPQITVSVTESRDLKEISYSSSECFVIKETKANTFSSLTASVMKVLIALLSNTDIKGNATFDTELLIRKGICKDAVNAERLIKSTIRIFKHIDIGCSGEDGVPVIIGGGFQNPSKPLIYFSTVFQKLIKKEINITDDILSLSDKAFLLIHSIVSRYSYSGGNTSFIIKSPMLSLSLGFNPKTKNATRDIDTRISEAADNINSVLPQFVKIQADNHSDDRCLIIRLSENFVRFAFSSEALYIDRLTPHGYRVIEYKDERIIRERTLCIPAERFGRIEHLPVKATVIYENSRLTVKNCRISFQNESTFRRFAEDCGIDDEEVIESYLKMRKVLLNRLINCKVSPSELPDPALAENILKKCLSVELCSYLIRYDPDLTQPYKAAENIIRRFGNEAFVKLKTAPFSAAAGTAISMKALEKIAKDNGCALNCEERISAYIQDAAKPDEGSTAQYFNLFTTRFKASFGTPFTEAYYPILENSDYMKTVCGDSDFIVSDERYSEEKELAEMIKKRCSLPAFTHSITVPAGLNEKQKAALAAVNYPLYIIDGRPGTGKTTVIKALINTIKVADPCANIVCCAPTGKAAKRLEEVTGQATMTVDMFLLKKPACNYMIIDEASMISEKMALELFKAIPISTKITLVGDSDQLPSVAAGAVFRDMIASGVVPKTTLTELMRLSESSTIAANAERIKDGNTILKTDDTFRIITASDSGGLIKELSAIINSMSPEICQVLCPIKDGAGTDALNKVLIKMVCKGKKLKVGKSTYRVGEKVILCENNYRSDYVNGDTGVVVDAAENGILVKCSGRIIQVTKAKDILPAYALTVHKSQGSEYDNVIIVLPETSFTDRRLLYTAVTRAKKKVIIIEAKNAVKNAIKSSHQRVTLLCELLKASLNSE